MSVANTMNLEKSSFQNEMQAIILKTNSLDYAVQNLTSKHNGDMLRFSNITEKIFSLKGTMKHRLTYYLIKIK